MSQVSVLRLMVVCLSWCLALSVAAPFLPEVGQGAWLRQYFGSQYRRGEQLELLKQRQPGVAATIVVVGRGDCSGCQLAKPHLSALLSRLSGTGDTVDSIFVTAGPAAAVDYAFARESGLRRVVPAPLSRLRTGILPTILLLDRSHTIRWIHKGLFDEGEARLVQSAVEAITQGG